LAAGSSQQQQQQQQQADDVTTSLVTEEDGLLPRCIRSLFRRVEGPFCLPDPAYDAKRCLFMYSCCLLACSCLQTLAVFDFIFFTFCTACFLHRRPVSTNLQHGGGEGGGC
jgi:hypothetical protein